MNTNPKRNLPLETEPSMSTAKTQRKGRIMLKKLICVDLETYRKFVNLANARRQTGEPILSGGVMSEVLSQYEAANRPETAPQSP